MCYVKVFPAVAALALFAGPGRASEPDRALVEKAQKYVATDKVSRQLLGPMHVGATYKGFDDLGWGKVNDARGRELPGEFFIKVRVKWQVGGAGADSTVVAYFFNAKGKFESLRPLETTAVFNQPFLAADVVVEVLRAALKDEIRGTKGEKILGPLVDAADAKGLAEVAIALGQP